MMSARDSFFKTVETNAQAEQARKDAFKKDVFDFQKALQNLHEQIQSWFAGSTITSSITNCRLNEGNDFFDVPVLTLKNGGKTLTVNPEGLYYFGVKGSVAVSIHSLSRSPNTSKFDVHWQDHRDETEGWKIVLGNPVQLYSFNEENFFKMIQDFA